MKAKFYLFLVAAFAGPVCLKAQPGSTKKEIQDLVANVCANGSVKLTAGQKARIADWLSVNGESITNVHPSEFKGEGPSMTNPGGGYSAADFKFAESKDALYVFAMDVPKTDMKIKELCTSIGGRIIGTVKLLGSNEKTSWEQEERELNLELLHVMPKDGVTVFKITWTTYYKEKPADKSIKILADH